MSHRTSESIDAGKHGKEYEIQMAKLAFKLLLEADVTDFKFTREKKGLGKFDDLTYIYETKDGEKKFTLVQLKHVLDESKKISFKDLTQDEKSYFLLPKYLTYYLESKNTILEDSDFENAQLDEVIICTNIGFEEDLGQIQVNKNFHPGTVNLSEVRHKLVISKEDRRNIFPSSYLSDRQNLADELTYYVMLNKRIDVNCLQKDDHVSMIRKYHIPLAETVIDFPQKKFKSDFLETVFDEEDILSKFRECFYKSILNFVSCHNQLSLDELEFKFKIKQRATKELKEKISLLSTNIPIEEFMRSLKLNINSNFENASNFQNISRVLPCHEVNVDDIDSKIEEFLENLTFVLDQPCPEDILPGETKEVVIAFEKRMNYWYSNGAYKDKEGNLFRDWIRKKDIISDALESPITFQRREIKLGQLISHPEDLCFKKLLQVFCSLPIAIGKEVGTLGNIESYYIERILMRHKVIHASVLGVTKHDTYFLTPLNQDVSKESLLKFIGSQTTSTESCFDSTSRFIFTGFTFEIEEFELMLNKYCQEYKWTDVHWAKYEGDYLVWEKTYGSLSALQKFFDKRNDKIELIEEKHLLEDDRMIILSGEPGMGKTTLLTHIAERLAATNIQCGKIDWIVLITLKDSSEMLEEIENVPSLEEVVKFICNFAVHTGNDEIEQNILRRFLSDEYRLTLLFDGFDEIHSEVGQTKMLNILTFLKVESKVKRIFISTRPHFVEQIENNCGELCHFIREISENDQIEFLCKYWMQKSELSKEKIFSFARNLVDRISFGIDNLKNQNFLAIPLQTFMVANVFESEVLKKEPALPETLSIVSLFENFLQTKYETYFTKCGVKIKENDRRQQNEIKSFRNMHQNFALCFGGVLSKEESQLFVQDEDCLDHDMVLDIGIVYKANEKFYFTHKTFAEFLIATQFAEMILGQKKYSPQCRKVIEKVLLTPGNELLLSLFDLKLTERYPQHHSVLIGNKRNVEKCNKKEIDAEDCLGRNFLYYAVQYKHTSIISDIVDKEVNVNLRVNFVVNAVITYLDNFYRVNEKFFKNSERIKLKSDHVKLTKHILKDDNFQFPPELIYAYHINLEMSSKNWQIVYFLLKRGYIVHNLSNSLNKALRSGAPPNIVEFLFDKVIEGTNFVYPLKEFTIYGSFSMIDYLSQLTCEEAEHLIGKYKENIVNVIQASKKSGLRFSFYEEVMKPFELNWSSLKVDSFDSLCEFFQRRCEIHFMLIKFLMENGAHFPYSHEPKVVHFDYFSFRVSEKEEEWDPTVQTNINTLLKNARSSIFLEPNQIIPQRSFEMFIELIARENFMGRETVHNFSDVFLEDMTIIGKLSSLLNDMLGISNNSFPQENYFSKIRYEYRQALRLLEMEVVDFEPEPMCLLRLASADGRCLMDIFYVIHEAICNNDAETVRNKLLFAESVGWTKALLNASKVKNMDIESAARSKGSKEILDCILYHKNNIHLETSIHSEKRRDFCVFV